MTQVSNKPILSKKTFDLITVVQSLATVLLVVALFLYHFGFANVPSSSMYPTLEIGASLIYQNTDPETLTYDDIVVFFPMLEDHSGAIKGYDPLFLQHKDKKEIYVKRLIGLPGDTLEIKDGYVYRNGQQLTPDYTASLTDTVMPPTTVPEGHFFVMGDNRNNSLDSRYYGAFPMDRFFGKIIFYVNPLFG